MSSAGSIEPQAASPVAGKGVMQQELAEVEVVDRQATADQRVIGIGDAIPVVFCKEEGDRGGAWVSPPAGRYGARTNPRDGDYWAFGMVVSDGRIASIPATDVYKGGSRLDKFTGYKSKFQYGSMPESGFNYTLSSVSPGDPGTPGTPGYWKDEQQSTFISAKTRLATQYPIGTTSGINFTLSINLIVVVRQIWVYVDNVPVHDSGFINPALSAGGKYTWSGSYTKGNTVIHLNTEGYDASSREVATLDVKYTTQVWVNGDPGIPPTPDTVSDLPLYPGSGGTYAGMSCLAASATYLDDSGAYTYRQQVRCFVRSGIQVESVVTGATGASNLFPDLAWYLLRKAHPNETGLIDKASFKSAAEFCEKNGLLFNGVLASSVNLRDYLVRTSKLFLLSFIQEQGTFRLVPLLPVRADYSFDTGVINPAFTFTADDIVAGSFSRTYVEGGDRQPFCALVNWRSQREAVFGVNKSTEVRFSGTAPDGPFEQYDLTEFCVDQEHAVLVAKYILSFRKHVTHTVTFALNSNQLALAPMSIIRINLSLDTSDGDRYVDSTLYMVDAIQEGPDGSVSIEATHFPVNDSDQSLVIADMIGGAFEAAPTVDATS